MKYFKNFSAKKYFLYALPAAFAYTIVAFFTIDRFFTGLYGRLIDFAVIIAILLFGLFKSRIEPTEQA